MPKIPQIQRQQSIPEKSGAVTAPIAGAGIVGQAVSTFGESIGKVGDALEQNYSRLKQQDDAITALTISNAYDDSEFKFKTEHVKKTGRDAFNGINAVNAFSDEQNQSLSDLATKIKDPLQKAKVQNYLHDKRLQLSAWAAIHEADQRKVVVNQTVDQTLETSMSAVYQGYASIETEIPAYENKLLELAKTNPALKEIIIDKIVKGSQQIAEAEVDKLVNANPAGFLALNQKGYYNKWLPKAKLDEFDKKANTIKDSMDKDVKAAKAEAEKLRAEQGLQMVEGIENGFVEKYINRTLTMADIIKSKPKDFDTLPSQVQNRYNSTAEKFIKLKEARDRENARIVKSEKKNSDSKVYNDFKIRALTDAGNKAIPSELKLSNADIDEAVLSGTLKPEWGKSLKGILGESVKLADPLMQKKIKLAIGTINNMEKNDLFGEKGSVEADTEKNDAIELLYEYLKKYPDKTPQDFAMELAQPYVNKALGMDFLSKDKPNPLQKKEEIKGRIKGGVKQAVPLDQWLPAAKKKNPLYTDDELKAIYKQNYGGK